MDLEEIRKKKLLELQHQQLQEQLELEQQIATLENIVKPYLTKEAISRYGTLKSAHPEKAIQTIALIAQAIQTGQIVAKIDDKMFKQFLLQLEGPKREVKIKRR